MIWKHTFQTTSIYFKLLSSFPTNFRNDFTVISLLNMTPSCIVWLFICDKFLTLWLMMMVARRSKSSREEKKRRRVNNYKNPIFMDPRWLGCLEAWVRHLFSLLYSYANKDDANNKFSVCISDTHEKNNIKRKKPDLSYAGQITFCWFCVSITARAVLVSLWSHWCSLLFHHH